MSQYDDFDRSLARWFEAEAQPAATEDVLHRALRATSRRRPHPRLVAALGSHWIGDGLGPTSGIATLRRTGVRTSMALLLLLLVLALVAGTVLVGGRLLLQPAPVDLGIFAPVAGRIVYGGDGGIWGVDPAAPEAATRVQLTSEAGSPLGWSRDGTQLLIMRGSSPEAELFVLHADGSETKVTERAMTIRGAAISPDGSRVVFEGVISTPEGECCEQFVLYAADADGGPPAEVLVESREGISEELTFSPDGTRIAYAAGAGDHSHSVWLMDADGGGAHQILSNETTAGAGHVRGLAWSPAGDRIALGLSGTIYTFALDGSDFTEVITNGNRPYWSPDGSQLTYGIACDEDPNGCGLAIADADGSNVVTFGFGVPGPWHPGKLDVAATGSVEPPSVPSLGPKVTDLLSAFIQARIDGLGAENFLSGSTADVPLLYATSTGAPFERGEFEPVLGIEWPYGWTAFKVRLYAGDTVLEQLFFTSVSGPGGLAYQYDGFRTDIAPTTEDGQAVGVPSTYFGGEVTMQNVHPWVGNKLIPEGVGPTTDGGQRNGWRQLIVKVVPASCQPSGPANAEGVAQTIGSARDIEATSPVAVSAGGANALMMDVVTAAATTACGFNFARGDRMRLYLIDAPEGSSMRVLAIAIVVPESSFARAVAPAASMVDSIEFHAP